MTDTDPLTPLPRQPLPTPGTPGAPVFVSNVPAPAQPVDPPRCGGVADNTVWCGGSELDPTSMPLSSNCFRTTKLKELQSIETQCKKGMSETYQLPYEERDKSKVTMTSWIPALKANIE